MPWKSGPEVVAVFWAMIVLLIFTVPPHENAAALVSCRR